jgi:hypothetical protein
MTRTAIPKRVFYISQSARRSQSQFDLVLPCAKLKAAVWCRVMVGLIRHLNESDQK